MIHVERIVRPVRADWSKLPMRRELLAHLQAAFDEERARGLDEPAALAQAKQRLGDPAELTSQLQASVSRLERSGATPMPRPLAWILLVLAIVIPIILAAALLPANIAPGPYRGIFLAGVVAMELAAVLLYFFTIEFFRDRVRWSRVAAAALAALIAQLAWRYIVSLALCAVPQNLTELARAHVMVIAFLATGGIVVILLRRPLRPWLELDITN
jgi:hypothetical protein